MIETQRPNHKNGLPALILTPAMQRDAFQMDIRRASLRRDMRAVHRLSAEAAKVTTFHLLMEARQ